jgi:hypothetical protein
MKPVLFDEILDVILVPLLKLRAVLASASRLRKNPTLDAGSAREVV